MKDLKYPFFLLSVSFVSKDLDILVDYFIFSTNIVIFLTIYMGLVYLN